MCRSADGQCPCLRNYGSRACNKCQVGYFDFPYCRSCNCHSAGIIVTNDRPTGCYQDNPVTIYFIFLAFFVNNLHPNIS